MILMGVFSLENLKKIFMMYFVFKVSYPSDGNAKDSIKIRSYMKFDYDDETDIPNLDDFKKHLAKLMLTQSYYQNEPKKNINLLKIPVIMAPSLLSKQVNNDRNKKSLLEKELNLQTCLHPLLLSSSHPC